MLHHPMARVRNMEYSYRGMVALLREVEAYGIEVSCFTPRVVDDARLCGGRGCRRANWLDMESLCDLSI